MAAGFTYSFDIGNDGTFEQTQGSSATLGIPASALTQDGLVTVFGSIFDKDGGQSDYTTTFIVNDVAPTITLTGASTAIEGQVYSLNIEVTDPGDDAILGYQIQWDENSPFVALQPNALTDIEHRYTDSSTAATITVAVETNEGIFTATKTISVANVAPTLTNLASAASDGSATVNEGDEILLTGDISDPGLDAFTVDIDWGDGTSSLAVPVDAGTTQFAFPHTYVDDGTYTIIATVTDDDGDSDPVASVDTTTQAITNVAPALVTSLDESTIGENSAATLQGTISDVGVADTHNVSIDWGDGTATEAVAISNGAFSATHIYDDDDPTATASDPYEITVTAVDENDASSSATETQTITVENNTPYLYLVETDANTIATAKGTNELVTLTAEFIDFGEQDTFTATIDWGDGTTTNPTITYDASTQTGSINTNRAYSSEAIFEITLNIVDDDTGASDTGVTQALVGSYSNAAPTVDDQTFSVPEGSGIGTEFGTVAAADGDAGSILTYTLEAQNEFSIDADTGVLSVARALLDAETKNNYAVEVTVTDEWDETATATLTINLEDVNEFSPTLNVSTLTYTIDENSPNGTVIDTFVATDADVDAELTFSVDANLPFAIDPVTGELTVSDSSQLDYETTQEFEVEVTVTDQDDNSDTRTVFVLLNDVDEGNVAPVLAPIGNQSVDEGVELTISASATDADQPANALTFSLDAGAPAGASIDPATGVFSWTPSEADGPGSFDVTVRVTDDGNPSLSASETITITVNEVNVAPVLAPIGDQSVNGGEELTFIAAATDADQPANGLTFSLDAGAPAGASIDPATGVFSWTPSESDGPGSFDVTVRVTDDGNPSLSASETVTITVNEVNVAPVLAPIGDQSVDEGEELTFIAAATDADQPANGLTFSLDAGAPAGASIDPATGVFSWTPSEADGPGSFDVTVRVTDDGNPSLAASETVTITVNEVNVAPVLAPIGDQSVDEGEELTFIAAATDADQPANGLTFSLDAGAPAGASIDPATGVFSWTPGEADGPGSFDVTVRVTDDGNPSLSASETITITVNEVNVAPVLAPIGDQSVNEGVELTFNASATDADQPANGLTFSLDAGAPAGASIDPATGVFSWTPSGPGSFDVAVRVTDDGNPSLSASETITIMVNGGNVAPVLAPIGDQSVNEGEELTFIASATDADQPANDLTFSLDSGAPAGASIDPTTGVFSWAPTEDQDPGVYSVTVRVTDDGTPALDDSETIMITVNNLAPIIAVDSAAVTVNEGDIAVNSGTFSDAGTDTVTLSASVGAVVDDNDGTWSWSFNTSDGPDDSQTVTITATDSDNSQTQVTFELSVNNIAPNVGVDIPTQIVQYSDSISAITFTATDIATDDMDGAVSYSIDGGATYTSGLPDALSLEPAIGLSFAGGNDQVATGTWTVSGVSDLAPGNYLIRVTVTDDDAAAGTADAEIVVLQENADASNTSPVFVSTDPKNPDNAVIPLQAIIRDITAYAPTTDGEGGNITKATASFVDRDSGSVIATVPVQLVGTDQKVGVVNYDWAVSLNGNETAASYNIGVIVDGYYHRNDSADDIVVTVARPDGDFITGGGHITNENSAGTHAGGNGLKTHFGFNIKFNKKMTNLQGHFKAIVRKDDGTVLQIKSNASDSLVVYPIDGADGGATFLSKANLTDVTDPDNPVSLGGNLQLTVNVTDFGEPGQDVDTIAFTLWDSNELLFSSNLDAATAETVQQVISGGNIQAHSQSSAGNGKKTFTALAAISSTPADAEQDALANDSRLDDYEPVDANRDGIVSPLDALLIINELNSSDINRDFDARLDVNGDASLSPLDALLVINRRNDEADQVDRALRKATGDGNGFARSVDSLYDEYEHDSFTSIADELTAVLVDEFPYLT